MFKVVRDEIQNVEFKRKLDFALWILSGGDIQNALDKTYHDLGLFVDISTPIEPNHVDN